MMFYNFCGIFIFTLIFANLLGLLFERPFYAMLLFKFDYKNCVTSQLSLHPDTTFNIEHYKIKEGIDEMNNENHYLIKSQLIENTNNGIDSNKNTNLSPMNNINVSQSRYGDGEKSTTLFDFSNSGQRTRELSQ